MTIVRERFGPYAAGAVPERIGFNVNEGSDEIPGEEPINGSDVRSAMVVWKVADEYEERPAEIIDDEALQIGYQPVQGDFETSGYLSGEFYYYVGDEQAPREGGWFEMRITRASTATGLAPAPTEA